MKIIASLIVLSTVLLSCGTEAKQSAMKPSPMSMVGTWQLLNATLIEKGDTTVTDYTKNQSFIKIINETHFAFLQHDLAQGKDTAVFVAGGGEYALKDSLYTEHLQYCSARDWEGNDFTFQVSIQNDTLVQRGIEKVAEAGVDRTTIEKYVKVHQ
ncbi:hypothetical protein [Pontibacter chitinilyticus]|uniref:hypothetical protein n=1 Tax=Pontibacter chitinilyticus TaxID=2674989 RepID=UPI00321A8FF9